MLLHRVFAYLPTAGPGESGHPDYLHRPQGASRFDNPLHYDVWYLADSPSGAVAETFADVPRWEPSMLVFPALPGSVRALGTYFIPDNLALLDLDSGRNLADRSLRPTEVITRVRAVTQPLALSVFNERDAAGVRMWAGVRWWSYHRPTWPICAVWVGTPENVDVQELTLDHPAVRDAARTLTRPL